MATRNSAQTGNKAVVKTLPVKKTSDVSGTTVKPTGKVALKRIEKQSKKEHKIKVVRDSFTMPHSEYQHIAEIKEICLQAGMHVKKSEVLRAGLKMLAKLTKVQLKRTLHDLEKIKTGRPRKH